MKFIVFVIGLLVFEANAENLSQADNMSFKALPNGQRIEMSSMFLPNKQRVDVYLPKDFQLDASHVEYPVIVTWMGGHSRKQCQVFQAI